MSKMVEQWLLFKYINGEFTPLSKPLKKKEQAEKARLKWQKDWDRRDPIQGLGRRSS